MEASAYVRFVRNVFSLKMDFSLRVRTHTDTHTHNFWCADSLKQTKYFDVLKTSHSVVFFCFLSLPLSLPSTHFVKFPDSRTDIKINNGGCDSGNQLLQSLSR